MSLIIKSSKVHGAGCYTTAPIKKGARIIEYTGPIITVEEADRLYGGVQQTYLFGLDDERSVIVGTGMAAFVNHSCEPNCETDDYQGGIWICALRDIRPGEELTYDYCLWGDEVPAPCHCGAKKCRGTMFSPEWIAHLKKLERKRKKAG